jgi:hypothetical protein
MLAGTTGLAAIALTGMINEQAGKPFVAARVACRTPSGVSHLDVAG